MNHPARSTTFGPADSASLNRRPEERSFTVYPVIDVRHGQVVRGLAGQRQSYAPWTTSAISTSTCPFEVARAFRQSLGLSTVYAADLDGIERGQPNLDHWHRIAEDGFGLWLDAGVRTLADLQFVASVPQAKIVLGLETCEKSQLLRQAGEAINPRQLAFSLDLRDGVPLTRNPRWCSIELILADVTDVGISDVIVLDLARVGRGQGTGTDDVCHQIRSRWPALRLVSGGGVRSLNDLLRLRGQGAGGALVASALHDARISLEDLRMLGHHGILPAETGNCETLESARDEQQSAGEPE